MAQDNVLGTVAEPTPGQRPMVLVAEDDQPVRELLSRLLRARGFDVHAVDNGAGAIKLATIVRFDAALIDLTMPGNTSGLNVIAWFRSNRSYGDALPVLILTGNLGLSESVQIAIQRLGAYVFYKGHSLNALVDQLTRLTAPSVFRSPVGDLLPAIA